MSIRSKRVALEAIDAADQKDRFYLAHDIFHHKVGKHEPFSETYGI
ncbi:hypothetical protein [Marinomonas rhizomae]|uniref:Uncharacterized protein n=1 Tax=Marinomonas rhizomae TaxID=491948 RepID=A0A366IXG0_9GAMM|nr:hypothetical protein [Marinomonas rhizomae]RBP79452.1 hypothetical protein DFP80_11441 [Marinomonas rhizomae]